MAATDRSTVVRARDLGDLLRDRRERLQPADVGLPAGTRRRTHGLRREEVALLARYRAAAGRHPDDPAFAELTQRLHTASPEVRAWWPRHDVAPLSSGNKRLRHPTLGELELQHVVLQVATNPEHKLVTFAPAADDHTRLAELIDGAQDANA